VTYYTDLTDYSYHAGVFHRPGTKNIGWLGLDHRFEKIEPTDETLRRLWSFCKISVAQTRGIHECEFCSSNASYIAERDGDRILLGSSEIRVFSKTGVIYAAPTLIYHYMAVHKYKPPDEFLRALHEGPTTPDQGYFDRLRELELEWRDTSTPAANAVRFRFDTHSSHGSEER